MICMEVCLQLDDPSDDITDQCRYIIKRIQNVNPTIVEVSSIAVTLLVCPSVCMCLRVCLYVHVSPCLSLCASISVSV